MPQVSVTNLPARAFNGMLGTNSPTRIRSYAAEGVVGIGKLCRLGTNKESQIVQLSTAVGQGALAWGFAVHNHFQEQTVAGLVQYDDKTTVPLMRSGDLWVETSDAVVAGATANYNLASQKLTDEVVGAGVEAIAGLSVKFLTGTTAAGLALVEVEISK